MNKLTSAKRAAVVVALVEGNSIRSTVRMTGVAKNTVVKLLADLGAACARFHDETVHNVNAKRVQCDEIWSFVYAKQKNVPADMQGQFGVRDVWTWTALDADAPYLAAVEDAFGADIDYAMLQKIYGSDPEGEKRYSPAKCIGAECRIVQGEPDPKHISTSYVERQNLSMRMSMRRFTRLTNAFSKKVQNHAAAVALYFVYYNFGRVHQTLRVTSAMEAGLTDHVWSISEIVALLDRP
jgi:hypothetical protein